MILFMLIYTLIGFFLLMYSVKISNLIFSISIIIWVLCSSITPVIMSNKLSNEKINIYSRQITEIKVKQYDIKDKNSKEYKENENKLADLIIQYNDEVNRYNDILKEDKEKFILFRWYFDEKEKEFYPLEVTTEYVAPDYYKG